MAIKAKIEVDNKELKKGLKDAEKQATSSMSKIAEATKSVNGGFKGMLGFLGKIGPYAAAAVAAIGLVITGIVAAIKAIHNLASNLNQIGKEANAVDMTTDSFQSLKYAAKIAGLEIQQVQKIVTKVQYALYQAEKGSKNAADAFADLGISWEELAKLSPDVQLTVILRALEKITDLSQRNKAIFQLFDKRDIQIINKMLKSDFSREVANAKNMGVNITPEAIKNAELYSDNIGIANQRLVAMVANWKLTKDLMKGMAEMAEEFTQSLNNSNGKVDEKYKALFQGIGDAADELEAKLKENDKEEWDRIQKLIQARADKIRKDKERIAASAAKGGTAIYVDEKEVYERAKRDILFSEVAKRDSRFNPDDKKTWTQKRVPHGYMEVFDQEYIKAGQIKNRLAELQEMLAKKKQKHEEELTAYDKEINAEQEILKLENELGIKADENQRREVITAAIKAKTVQNQVAVKMLEEEIKLMELEAEIQVAVINGDTKRAEILRSIIKLRNKGINISEEDIENNEDELKRNKENLEILKKRQELYQEGYKQSKEAEAQISALEEEREEAKKRLKGAEQQYYNGDKKDRAEFAEAYHRAKREIEYIDAEIARRKKKIDSLKEEVQVYKDLGDQIDKTNEKITKNEAAEAANQTGKAAEDAQKKVDDANIKRKSEQLELENKIAQAELDGDLERADNLRLINELKQMGINITEEELEKDKERYKELVKQRDLQKQLNLEKSFKDKGDSLLTQAMKQTGFAKEAAYLEAIRNAEKTKGAKLTDEEIEKVKRMTDLQFRLNDLGKLNIDDMSIKTNELTARGGFASGALFTDKETINEQIKNYAAEQTKLLNDIKQEIKNGGLI